MVASRWSYTTMDSEHKPEDAAEMERAAMPFFSDADLVIFSTPCIR